MKNIEPYTIFSSVEQMLKKKIKKLLTEKVNVYMNYKIFLPHANPSRFERIVHISCDLPLRPLFLHIDELLLFNKSASP